MLAVDGEPVAGVDDLHRLMTAERIGREVELTVARGGEARTLTVRPEELSSSPS